MELFHHKLILPTNTQTVTLIGVGCVHADDPGFVEDLWLECIEQIERTPLCWVFGVGDYFTLARTHYRNYLRAYRQDEDSQRELDALVKDRAREFHRKYLKRIQGKLLGLAEGNHTWEFQNGTTDTQYLCELAQTKYLGYASWHRLQFLHKSGHSLQILNLLLHHGNWSGGGFTTGGDVNALERRAEGWASDIVVTAHTHRKWAQIVPIMELPATGVLKIVERPRVFIRSGCFVRGYVQGCVTYAERKLLKPTSLGHVTLRIQFYQPSDPAKYKRLLSSGASPDEASARGRDAVRYRFRVEY